jgi:hypothetical protein
MSIHVLGVYRETEFSPGKVEADAAILDCVLDHLRARDVEVVTIEPDRFVEAAPDDFDLVLAMCQGERTLSKLAAVEKAGILVINSPHAIRSCYRDRLGPALEAAGVPTPAGVLVNTSTGMDPLSISRLDLASGVFIKRGDLHALIADDVVRVDGSDRIASALAGFAARGIKSAYLQQAVEGIVVKFYGVSGGGYFATLSDGAPLRASLQRALAEAAGAAAAALGLEVWGGDAIVNGDAFMIVDLNDWPSFSRVRAAAARAIAERCCQLLDGAGAARKV